MSVTIYSGIIQMGDARYYTRLSFDIPAGISAGNITDEADGDLKALQMMQQLAELSGGTLTFMTKGIFAAGSPVVPDADPDFENTSKLLIDFGENVSNQVRIPAVEPGTDIQIWFAGALQYILGPVFQQAVSIVMSTLTQQRKPRAGV